MVKEKHNQLNAEVGSSKLVFLYSAQESRKKMVWRACMQRQELYLIKKHMVDVKWKMWDIIICPVWSHHVHLQKAEVVAGAPRKAGSPPSFLMAREQWGPRPQGAAPPGALSPWSKAAAGPLFPPTQLAVCALSQPRKNRKLRPAWHVGLFAEPELVLIKGTRCFSLLFC